MYSMAKYNFENYLENASAPLYRNSAKVLALEDHKSSSSNITHKHTHRHTPHTDIYLAGSTLSYISS